MARKGNLQVSGFSGRTLGKMIKARTSGGGGLVQKPQKKGKK